MPVEFLARIKLMFGSNLIEVQISGLFAERRSNKDQG
jgi:hypothetical protein